MAAMRYVALVGVLLLTGCEKMPPTASERSDESALVESRGQLVAILANTATPEESRQAADAKLVQLVGAKDSARLAVLEQIVWGTGHSQAMRIYALNKIAATDPALAGRVLMLHLPRMDDWEVLERACVLSVELGDLRVVDSLIRSLARPAKKYARIQRPELAAIEKLTNKKIVPALREQLVLTRDQSVQVAIIDLLSELAGTEHVKKLILEKEWRNGEVNGNGAAVEFLGYLHWWVERFDTVPVGGQEVEWIKELSKNEKTANLATAVRRHQKLRGQKDYLVTPRFVSLLENVDHATVEMTRGELNTEITRCLAALKHIQRESDQGEASPARDESFAGNEAKLSRCDLLTILALLRGLDSPQFQRQVLEQGLADMTDTETEHGGVLKLGESGLSLLEYAPLYKSNDQQYIVSDKLLRELVYGIAEYHFHFQKVFNQNNAGPGKGDLEFTQKTRCNAVVFTSVGKGEFNVDYYTPDGAIVDLGVWPARRD